MKKYLHERDKKYHIENICHHFPDYKLSWNWTWNWNALFHVDKNHRKKNMRIKCIIQVLAHINRYV